jgi:predicted Na+-dependent transporter
MQLMTCAVLARRYAERAAINKQKAAAMTEVAAVD